MVLLWTSAASPWKASPSSTFPACTAAPTFGARARRGGATAREAKRAKTRGRRCSTPKSSRLPFKVTLTPEIISLWLFNGRLQWAKPLKHISDWKTPICHHEIYHCKMYCGCNGSGGQSTNSIHTSVSPCLIDSHEILSWHSWCSEDESLWLLVMPGIFIWHHQWVKLTYPVKYFRIYRIDCFKCCADIQGPQRLNPCDFGDPRTFYLAPRTGHSFSYLVEYLTIHQTAWWSSFTLYVYC